MFKHYLTVALRHLVKNKLHSAINIVGLAVGLAACLLIMLFVRDEFSYDNFWPNADQIYRLQVAYNHSGRAPIVTTRAPGPAREAIKAYFPEEIEYSARIFDLSPVVKQGERVFSESVHWVDPEFIDIFTLDIIAGDIKATLTDNSSLAINQSFAKKYFGDENPLGKTLNISSLFERDYRIGAVFKDLPHNTTLSFQALAMLDENDLEPWFNNNWGIVRGHTFFTLKNNAAIANIDSQLASLVDKSIPIPDEAIKASEWLVFSTLGLKDIQLKSKGLWEMKPTGSLSTVLILISIGGLILLIACINFINLSTARSLQRAREVALRKVLGAKRQQLIIQFLGESILTAIAGLVLGLVLMEMALPAFSSFLDRPLGFYYSDGLTLAMLFGLVTFVGLLGGLYPALVLSGFIPSQILKANKTTETEGAVLFRKILVTLQFSISIFLVITTTVVYGQMKYATGTSPGFNKDNMLVLSNISRPEVVTKQQVLKEQVAKLASVASASYSSNPPSSTSESNISVKVPGKPNLDGISIGFQLVDENFFSTYKIPLLAGRNYRKNFVTDGTPLVPENHDGSVLEGTIIINKSAVSKLGFDSPDAIIGQSIQTWVGRTPDAEVYGNLRVVGVVPDIRFRSLRKEIQAELYPLSGPWMGYYVLAIKFNGDPLVLTQQLETLWKGMFPNTPFSYKFVDELTLAEFKKEQHLSTIMGFFSLLAIAIAALGLYALAAFTAERRTKEIGIRKVLGANIIDIVQLLIWQFSKPIVIAILIASPIATWATIRWLETFPYRLDNWVLIPICLCAGLIALVIGWATVGGNTAKVARQNPIKALRYE